MAGEGFTHEAGLFSNQDHTVNASRYTQEENPYADYCQQICENSELIGYLKKAGNVPGILNILDDYFYSNLISVKCLKFNDEKAVETFFSTILIKIKEKLLSSNKDHCAKDINISEDTQVLLNDSRFLTPRLLQECEGGGINRYQQPTTSSSSVSSIAPKVVNKHRRASTLKLQAQDIGTQNASFRFSEQATSANAFGQPTELLKPSFFGASTPLRTAHLHQNTLCSNSGSRFFPQLSHITQKKPRKRRRLSASESASPAFNAISSNPVPLSAGKISNTDSYLNTDTECKNSEFGQRTVCTNVRPAVGISYETTGSLRSLHGPQPDAFSANSCDQQSDLFFRQHDPFLDIPPSNDVPVPTVITTGETDPNNIWQIDPGDAIGENFVDYPVPAEGEISDVDNTQHRDNISFLQDCLAQDASLPAQPIELEAHSGLVGEEWTDARELEGRDIFSNTWQSSNDSNTFFTDRSSGQLSSDSQLSLLDDLYMPPSVPEFK